MWQPAQCSWYFAAIILCCAANISRFVADICLPKTHFSQYFELFQKEKYTFFQWFLKILVAEKLMITFRGGVGSDPKSNQDYFLKKNFNPSLNDKYKNSSIPSMQRMLNEDERKLKCMM